MNKTFSLIGVVLLAFLASAPVIVGFLVSFRTYDSVDPRDTSVAFYGFLMTTLGVGITVASCRIATKLGAAAAKGVEGFIGVFLSFFGIPAFLALITSVWYEHKWPTGLPPGGLVWFSLAVLETMAVLVWLLIRGRRARKAAKLVVTSTAEPHS
jgi:hypothetical protein